ncbi:MAG: hypothetical protein JO127_04800 [Caulobacteraceae bacterium]|nr:hypothetical protein [Caulobacteraceae bacterium]
MAFDSTPSAPAPPHAREKPPWADCGDVRDPDFGRLFAVPGAGPDVLVLYFDRALTRHAATAFEAARVGAELVLHGRRFDVVRLVAERR